MLKRYQVYLNATSVGVFDEASQIGDFSRSFLIREAVNAAASRISNLLTSLARPKNNNYSELDKMTDSIKIKGKRLVNLSQNIDEIYYR